MENANSRGRRFLHSFFPVVSWPHEIVFLWKVLHLPEHYYCFSSSEQQSSWETAPFVVSSLLNPDEEGHTTIKIHTFWPPFLPGE